MQLQDSPKNAKKEPNEGTQQPWAYYNVSDILLIHTLFAYG